MVNDCQVCSGYYSFHSYLEAAAAAGFAVVAVMTAATEVTLIVVERMGKSDALFVVHLDFLSSLFH